MPITFNQYIPSVGLDLSTYYAFEGSDTTAYNLEVVGGRRVLKTRSFPTMTPWFVDGSYRCELTQRAAYLWPLGDDVWIRWAIMIPPSSVCTGLQRRTVSQIHASPQAGGGSPPPFFWEQRADGTISFCCNLEPSIDTYRRSERLAWWPVAPGQWHEFVVQIKFSKTAGRVKLWHNGKLDFERHMQTMFDANSNAYWKAGQYGPPGAPPKEFTTYTDGMTAGTGYRSPAEFLNAAGITWRPTGAQRPLYTPPTEGYARFHDGYLYMSSNAAYTFGQQPVSIAAWIRPRGTWASGGVPQYQAIMSDNISSMELCLKNYGQVAAGATDFDSHLRGEAKTAAAANYRAHTSELNFFRYGHNRWSHVVGQLDPRDGAWTFWIDGTRYECFANRNYGLDYVEAQAPLTFPTPNTTFFIGARHSTKTLRFFGDIADVRLTKGVLLTDEEVRNVMAGHGSSDGLIGEWIVDDATTDISATKNNATKVDAVTWVPRTSLRMRRA